MYTDSHLNVTNSPYVSVCLSVADVLAFTVRYLSSDKFKGKMKRYFFDLVVILLLTMAVVGMPAHAPHAPHVMFPAPMTAFSGGTFEASGVAHVTGTNAVLFVDDGRPNEIFWMQLGEDRKQTGAIKTVNIATSIIDLEGITTDGEYFYVVGSQSKSKGADLAGLARFEFDSNNQRVQGTEAAAGLKKLLADNVAELRGLENTKYNDGGTL